RHPEIPEEHALRGFAGVRAYTSDLGRSAPFLWGLGFTPGWEARGEKRGSFYIYDDAPPERGLSGAGTVHHVAWACEADEQEAWRERVIAAAGQPTPIIDRFYFKSIYFREPSGVLFEIATLGGPARRLLPARAALLAARRRPLVRGAARRLSGPGDVRPGLRRGGRLRRRPAARARGARRLLAGRRDGALGRARPRPPATAGGDRLLGLPARGGGLVARRPAVARDRDRPRHLRPGDPGRVRAPHARPARRRR